MDNCIHNGGFAPVAFAVAVQSVDGAFAASASLGSFSHAPGDDIPAQFTTRRSTSSSSSGVDVIARTAFAQLAADVMSQTMRWTRALVDVIVIVDSLRARA